MPNYKQTNIRLPEKERELLNEIAKTRAISKSGTIRQLILEEKRRMGK
jgi:predicted DNA-binding protein